MSEKKKTTTKSNKLCTVEKQKQTFSTKKKIAVKITLARLSLPPYSKSHFLK
jgi:hypothetical protein